MKLELAVTPEARDSADFVAKLDDLPGSFRKVIFTEDNVLKAAFWASREQKDLASSLGSVILIDTTSDPYK